MCGHDQSPPSRLGLDPSVDELAVADVVAASPNGFDDVKVLVACDLAAGPDACLPAQPIAISVIQWKRGGSVPESFRDYYCKLLI